MMVWSSVDIRTTADQEIAKGTFLEFKLGCDTTWLNPSSRENRKQQSTSQDTTLFLLQEGNTPCKYADTSGDT